MEHEAVVLRSELSKMARGRGNRFPAELRERVIVYGRRRRADGASWTRIGIELGMKWETVRGWCIEKRSVPAQIETCGDRGGGERRNERHQHRFAIWFSRRGSDGARRRADAATLR